MKFLAALIRAVFFVIALIFTVAVVGTVMLVGSVIYLLSGRKPKVRVFRGANLGDVFQSQASPPMKDVTPRDVTPSHQLETNKSV
jgi:hypothetical protein